MKVGINGLGNMASVMARGKHFTLSQNTQQMRSITEDTNDANFVANKSSRHLRELN
jgi:hypothetical protein